jgi:hypothetical protein
MPKQTVPDIDFDKFVIAQIPRLFNENKILINSEYQRGDSHHVIAHSKGGKTADLDKAQLLHEACHRKIEKRAKLIAEFV